MYTPSEQKQDTGYLVAGKVFCNRKQTWHVQVSEPKILAYPQDSG
jgi:hypothetical protein